MDKVSYSDFYKLKIKDTEDISSFITLCKKYTSQENLEDSCTVYMLNEFFKAVSLLANQIEKLNNDFIDCGLAEDVEDLRNKANSISATALKLIQVVELIPYEFSSKNTHLQLIQNVCWAWANYSITAEKLVSEDIASDGLQSKEKFIKLVAPSNAHVIQEVFETQNNLFNKHTEAKLLKLKSSGRNEQAKLIVDIYNHNKIIISPKKKRKLKSLTVDIKDGRRTTVHLIDKKGLWLLLPAFAAPFVGFALYGTWWMFFCVVLVAAIQIFPWAALNSNAKVDKTIFVDELDLYAKSESRIDGLMRLSFIIIAVLDSFPFLASYGPFIESAKGTATIPYEGGVLVSIITILLIIAWVCSAFLMEEPSVVANKKSFDETGKTLEQQSEERTKESNRRAMVEMQQKINKYGVGYVALGHEIYANEKSQKLYIKSKEIDFKDILDFYVQDNAVTIHSASISTAKTNTGSMFGRALVGGALFGDAGAIIGGSTAKKTIEHSGSQSRIVHDYKVVITVNSISSPNVTIRIGDDEKTLNNIVSTLTIILNRK